MGRVTRGNEEDLVEPEGLACLARNGQMTVVHGIETAAESRDACQVLMLDAEGCSVWASFQHSTLRPEDDQVVPVDDFLVFLRAELLLNLDRFEPFDPCQGVGGEVHESFGEFFAILVEATDRISRYRTDR